MVYRREIWQESSHKTVNLAKIGHRRYSASSDSCRCLAPPVRLTAGCQLAEVGAAALGAAKLFGAHVPHIYNYPFGVPSLYHVRFIDPTSIYAKPRLPPLTDYSNI